MKIGIIAGNRRLPLLLARRIKEKDKDCELIAFCFQGETSGEISAYADKVYWMKVGQLRKLKDLISKEGITRCLMAGQISPLKIFNRKGWDRDLLSLVSDISDFRPHTIFSRLIDYLQGSGLNFLDSISYLKEDLAKDGLMNALSLSQSLGRDIDFGLSVAFRFVELDVGQVVVVKSQSVVALESLEGTDNTIKRAHKLVGSGLTVLKFCKANQDLRFDVAVVGIPTLKLLKRVGAKALVLETGKVIILDKPQFLDLAKKYNIAVLGKPACQ